MNTSKDEHGKVEIVTFQADETYRGKNGAALRDFNPWKAPKDDYEGRKDVYAACRVSGEY
ncbi:hypothetical protein FTO70_04630 [Methanosarcina sp. KYL-1]|uniref:hypothetical protein n=1 Tax=Methanosarcina sp. KYL-1 TaxID=2602068 RepID=UPI002100C23B|nr:hypothetical protein [Methanosarcina sp. KYL-1]MCQ1534984.1 hypothetical protein [Methanosarcina sp. KYL-1]